MNKLVAVLEDDPDIRELISLHLKRAGLSVIEFSRAGELLSFLKKRVPDILILDLMLPDEDGLEVCRTLRNSPTTAELPIIIVSARGDEVDRILGFELGADDYLPKPFSPRELVARVKAKLRRTSWKRGEKVLSMGPLTLYLERFSAFLEEKPLPLTTTEFLILSTMLAHPGRVFTRGEIIDYLWKGEKIITERTVDVHIRRIREKMGKWGKIIKSVRGIGYKVEAFKK